MKGWTDHGEILPPGYVEDFRIVERTGVVDHDKVPAYRAYFVTGPNFQNMRLHIADAEGPAGPIIPGTTFCREGDNYHTRLYSGRLNDRERIITAVWPGLPKVGLWLFREESFGMIKELLVAPKEGTGYSIAAANPAVIKVRPGHFEIFFEGRNEVVHWNVFRARWKGFGLPVVDDEPFIADAANPSLVRHGSRIYLYYSAHAGSLFSTRCLSIEADDLM